MAKQVAVFKASREGQVFVLPSNIEAIRDWKGDNSILYYSAKGINPSMVDGDSFLLSKTHFGHKTAYLPADGSLFEWFFNKAHVVYIETKGKDATVTMRSGNQYFVRAETQIIVRDLIARNFDVKPQVETPAPRRLADAVPELDDLGDN